MLLSNKQYQIDLLTRLIQFETPDPPGSEAEMATYIKTVLDEHGVPATLDIFDGNRANVIVDIDPAQAGGRKSRLAFSAHMDTVPAGDGWSTPPFSPVVKGDRIYGRGSTDMKSAVAAMIITACAINQKRDQLFRPIRFLFSGGESSNCLGARRLVKNGYLEDVDSLIIGEPSTLDLIIAHKGSTFLKLTCYGRQGHVSGDPGRNAINEMAAVIIALKKLQFPKTAHAYSTDPTLNVGTITGGRSTNVTPDLCEVTLDLRTPPDVDADVCIEIIRKSLPDTNFNLEVTDRMGFMDTSPDDELVQLCSKVCGQITQSIPKLLGVAYISDASIFCQNRTKPLSAIVLGPGELGLSTQIDESVSIDLYLKSVEIYKQIALAELDGTK